MTNDNDRAHSTGDRSPPTKEDSSLEHERRKSIAHDLAANLQGEIRNPLHDLSRSQLLKNVAEFHRSKGLPEDSLPYFRKGAIVAQNPAGMESEEGLDDEDRTALREEVTRRWRQPKALYLTIILNSVAAAIQGWDQTGSNGANLSFPDALGIPNTAGSSCGPDANAGTCAKNQWIQGLINAMPYITIWIFSGWASDPLNHYFGRRVTIWIGAIFSLIAPFGMAVSQTWGQLLACRMLLGIGMGLKEVTVPVYSSENAPAVIRGALTMSWQLWTAFGKSAYLLLRLTK